MALPLLGALAGAGARFAGKKAAEYAAKKAAKKAAKSAAKKGPGRALKAEIAATAATDAADAGDEYEGIDEYKKGGKVRGCGCAKRGVRKCKMY